MRATLQKNPDDVARMFDGVAERYDLTNDVLTFGLTPYWRRVVVRAVDAKQGEKILDLAAGTGTSSEPYADAGIDVVASDFSEGMLAVGCRRRPDINFVQADAMNLPFEDNTFDVVTISYGIRNIHDPHKALREMLRVTKPGGRLVIAEFSDPTFTPFRVVYKEYLMKALPWVASKVSSNAEAYKYLAESIREWPAQDEFAHWIQDAGWQNVQYRNMTGGIVAIHRGFKAAADS